MPGKTGGVGGAKLRALGKKRFYNNFYVMKVFASSETFKNILRSFRSTRRRIYYKNPALYM